MLNRRSGSTESTRRGRSTRRRPILIAGLVAALGLLVLAGPAGAKTYAVGGKQVAVNEEAGTYSMKGGLLGSWKMTSFDEIATSPLYRAKGTEKFRGCIDRRRDRSCAGDPKGTLDFRFLYWGLFGAGDSLVWGSCWHPITGGTGDFAGARGVLTFVDTPRGKGVSTSYVGNVTMAAGSSARRSAASASPAGCGPR